MHRPGTSIICDVRMRMILVPAADVGSTAMELGHSIAGSDGCASFGAPRNEECGRLGDAA
jgi:hypothetical protein